MTFDGPNGEQLPETLRWELSELVTGLKRFLLEDNVSPLSLPAPASPLYELATLVEHLRLASVKQAHESEQQTISEGALELKRRGQMREISSEFTDSVGHVVVDLIRRGDEGTRATEAAVATVTEMVAKTEAIRTAIETVIEQAATSSDSVRDAVERAEAAIEITADVQAAAKEIVHIVDLIDSISFKTNMLALNASIEAARAGAAGRGFSVVAQEVKTLSTHTSEAAQRIKETAEGMHAAANTMTEAVIAIKSANQSVSQTTSDTVDAINQQVRATQEITERAETSGRQVSEAEARIRAIQTEARRLSETTENFVKYVSAEPGVTDDTVLFGQSAPFTGAVANLGLGTRKGIELAFAEAAAAGGIHGRLPKLEALDDAYNPDKALDNVRSLVRSGKVFGLVGAVGTPTSRLSERIARGGRVPFVGPVTGAAMLREPDRSHVVNIRASYPDEGEALIRHFQQVGGLDDTALFMQADAYGQAIKGALDKAMQANGYTIDLLAPYERASGDVSAAVQTILSAKPSIVFMAGTTDPSAKFVRAIREAGLNCQFATVSFAGTAAFAQAVKPYGDGIVVSQVVPMPSDKSLQINRDLHAAIEAHARGTVPDFSLLEGYLTGRVLCEMLERCGPDPTRESFLDTIFSTPTTLDFGGMRLSYGPRRNTGTSKVFLTEIGADGSFAPLTGSELRRAS